MGFSQHQMPAVDAELARAKDALRQLRQQFNVTDDITYRIRYNGLGEIVVVTVERAPPGLPPDFINAATKTIANVMTLPRTADSGVLSFVDLGPASAAHATEINANQDRIAAEQAAKHKQQQLIIGIVIVVIVLIAMAAGK